MKISVKNLFIPWIVTFVVIAVGNAWFHSMFAGKFVEEGISAIGAVPMAEQRFVYLVFVWALIATATVYFTLRDLPEKDHTKHALTTGALVGLVADGTWNFVNATLVPSYSITFALGDTSWHVIQGAIAALICVKLYLRSVNRNKK